MKGMEFDHERLEVYKVSLDFLVFADRLLGAFPRGRGYFADQLGRAALSIVLNIAEGAGKLSPADKRRFYQTARGSATGSAALLDASQRVKLITNADHRAGKELLFRLVSMLVKLSRSFETPLVPEKR
jgi:four helix bundle protein